MFTEVFLNFPTIPHNSIHPNEWKQDILLINLSVYLTWSNLQNVVVNLTTIHVYLTVPLFTLHN